MICLTLSFFFTEIIVGEFSHSNALRADAFHMLSDVLALFVAYVSVYVSPKNWSKNTYGFARAEVLGALVNSVFLMALCFTILTDSLKRFIEPENIRQPLSVLAVGAVGLAINITGLCLFHDHGHSHGGGSGHGHSHQPSSPSKNQAVLEEGVIVMDLSAGHDQHHSHHCHHGGLKQTSRKGARTQVDKVQMNIKGVFLHILADALGSVVVIVSALAVYRAPEDNIYVIYVDPTLSIILVILIACATWPLLRESAYILMQTMPGYLEMSDLRSKLLEEVPEIVNVHDFHVWQLVASRLVASIHVQLGRDLAPEEHMQTAEKIKEFFHHQGIHATTVQLEYKRDRQKLNSKGCAVPCPRADTTSESCTEGAMDFTNSPTSSDVFPLATLAAAARRSTESSKVALKDGDLSEEREDTNGLL